MLSAAQEATAPSGAQTVWFTYLHIHDPQYPRFEIQNHYLIYFVVCLSHQTLQEHCMAL